MVVTELHTRAFLRELGMTVLLVGAGATTVLCVNTLITVREYPSLNS